MQTRLTIVGGGPGGYEAALVATKQGAEVTLIERQGVGGNAVLTDVVPSKTIIATAEWRTIADRAPTLGIRNADGSDSEEISPHRVDMAAVNARIRKLVGKQTGDIRARLESDGVSIVEGEGRMVGPFSVAVRDEQIESDVTLLALGARPRVLPAALPDGDRIFTWTQLYELTEVPERLVVVGSGVTGAEFAGAYQLLGSHVTLVSSSDRVLGKQDPEAAQFIQDVFDGRGMTMVTGSHAATVENVGTGVKVTLVDGRIVEGSHCLMAVGSVPNTDGVGLENAGIAVDEHGFVAVDRVSRTSVRGVYAAGDCTGLLPLASVAAMQGRIAVAHALGDAVQPIELSHVAANVFTTPEIATVGATEQQLKDRGIFYKVSRLEFARNPRAKMLGIDHGFVKIFGHTVTGMVLGAVIVGPRAGEHIFPLALAVTHRLTVDDVASTFTVYPSLNGTIAEAARRLHNMTDPTR